METELVMNSKAVLFEDMILMDFIRSGQDMGLPYSRNNLIALHKQFFANKKIEEARGHVIDNSYTFQLHITKLREFGLVTPEGKFLVTEAGDGFLDTLTSSGYGGWKGFPIVVPYTDGTFRWTESLFLQELL